MIKKSKTAASNEEAPKLPSKKKELEKLLDSIRSKYKDSSVVSFASEKPRSLTLWSDIPAFDGITGGFPLGRIVEFVGPESSTKSYMAYTMIARFQSEEFLSSAKKLFKDAGIAVNPEDLMPVLIDVEGTYTKEWGERVFGIDNERLIYVQPDSIEQSADIAQVFLQYPTTSLVCYDSMSYTGAKGEVEETADKDQMAINARFWNKTLRKFGGSMNKNKNIVRSLLMINSEYTKVSMYGGTELKNGIQLRLSKSLSVKFRPVGRPETVNDIVVGRNYNISTLKNKTGVPFMEDSYHMSLEDGPRKNKLNIEGQLISIASQYGIVKKSGSWYSYLGHKVQGQEALVELLSKDLTALQELKDLVYHEIEATHRA